MMKNTNTRNNYKIIKLNLFLPKVNRILNIQMNIVYFIIFYLCVHDMCLCVCMHVHMDTHICEASFECCGTALHVLFLLLDKISLCTVAALELTMMNKQIGMASNSQ